MSLVKKRPKIEWSEYEYTAAASNKYDKNKVAALRFCMPIERKPKQ